jgi:hypothetical protein
MSWRLLVCFEFVLKYRFPPLNIVALDGFQCEVFLISILCLLHISWDLQKGQWQLFTDIPSYYGPDQF